MVQITEVLPGMDSGENVGEWESLPAIFQYKNGSRKVHFRHEAKGFGGLGGTSNGGKACAGRDPAVREI